MKSWISRFIRDVSYEFSDSKIKLAWKLFWFIPIYLSLFLTAILISISSLSIEDGIEFIRDAT